MKRILLLMTACITLSSCSSYKQITDLNRQSIMRLSPGMDKESVMNVMGVKTFNVDGDKISNPYKSETLKSADNSNYLILFYYTDIKKLDGVISEDELTPVVFKDNKLEGWGWSYLNDNMKKIQVNVR